MKRAYQFSTAIVVKTATLLADARRKIVAPRMANFIMALSTVFMVTGRELANAQFLQIGTKIVGSGSVGSTPSQGYAVALSSDGNTFISGGNGDNSDLGAAWVFVRSSGGWSQQGNKLVGTLAGGGAGQGTSVSISADGNTAFVGGCDDNGGVGASWVFVRSGGLWKQQSKLVGTGASGFATQGFSVSISADGNTAIVGGPYDSSQAGAAWVFTRTGPYWSQQGGKLVGTGVVGLAHVGQAVAVSADGNTAIIGGPYDNSNAGAAWVFSRSGGVWTQQGSKLVGTGAVGTSIYQGSSVSLSADGNTAAIGGYADNVLTGAVWVFTRSGSSWTQQGSKLVGAGAIPASAQGSSVSLSADGNMILVGSSEDDFNLGAAWVFTRSGNTWTQQGSKLGGSGVVNGYAYQGYSVALSGDGNTAVIGGYGDNSYFGASWIFVNGQPRITSVKDVPNDQGGHVFVNWKPSSLDAPPCAIVSNYIIFLGVSSSSLPAGSIVLSPGEYEKRESVRNPQLATEPIGIDRNVFFRTTPGPASPLDLYWQQVGWVSPSYLNGYSFTASTPSDSGPQGNSPYYFMVRSATSDPATFWNSTADSGFSVDNLPPGPVMTVSALPQPGPSVNVHWSKDKVDPDVGVYEVHRSTVDGFTPGPSTKIGQTSDTALVDASPVNGSPNYYRIVTVDIHGNKSVPSQQASAGVTVMNQYGVADKWNLISVPLTVGNYAKSILYPTSVSNAFSYAGGYTQQATLSNGAGYWLKFAGGQNVSMTGFLISNASIPVQAGWNLIGSISTAVPVGSISSNPGGMVASNFFGYESGYKVATQIEPGQGYWIKVNQSGNLILSSSSNVPAESRLRITPDAELPPAPPDAQISNLSSQIPTEFSLGQNYPNPFNPSTVIRYQLPVMSFVRLEVYNMLGQLVAALVNEQKPAGMYNVSWDATNVPSGIYFYKLVAGSFSETKKLAVLK